MISVHSNKMAQEIQTYNAWIKYLSIQNPEKYKEMNRSPCKFHEISLFSLLSLNSTWGDNSNIVIFNIVGKTITILNQLYDNICWIFLKVLPVYYINSLKNHAWYTLYLHNVHKQVRPNDVWTCVTCSYFIYKKLT